MYEKQMEIYGICMRNEYEMNAERINNEFEMNQKKMEMYRKFMRDE